MLDIHNITMESIVEISEEAYKCRDCGMVGETTKGLCNACLNAEYGDFDLYLSK